MRRTTWVALIVIAVAGLLPGVAHDGCADAGAESEGLMCAMLTGPESGVMIAGILSEWIAHAPELPASTLTPLDHPPKSLLLSA